MTAKVYVTCGDERTDVTEEVKIVLDRLSSSLDWGSGFLCADDIEAWGKIAKALGMDANGIDEQVSELREDDRVRSILDRERADIQKASLYQIRTAQGDVLEEFVHDRHTGIQWETPRGRRRVFYLWENYGAGWRNLGRFQR